MRAGCCARAASDHTAVAPPSNLMNLRRFTPFLASKIAPPYRAAVYHGKLGPLMSELGQNRSGRFPNWASGLPLTSEIVRPARHVSNLPKRRQRGEFTCGSLLYL